MGSDDSTQTVCSTISPFNDSDFETPDEFLDSKSSPTNFFQLGFQPRTPPTLVEPSLSPCSHPDATPNLPPIKQ